MKSRILVIVLVCAIASTPLAAQDDRADLDPSLEAQMVALERETEALRGLTAVTQVDHAFPTRDDVRAYITDQYREQLTPELARRALAFYVALGILPPGTDLRGLFIEAYSTQVAGYYDTDAGVMNVVPMVGDDPGSRLSLTERAIYVHEFTHALQDQHFDLDALIGTEEAADHPDRLLAALSLVEGDATLSMTLYLKQATAGNPLAGLSMLVEGLQAGNLLPPAGIPAPLLRELLFPYETGMNFVISLYARGGWQAVNDAFSRPPVTSEQILHADKYLAGEAAQTVTLAESQAVLGEDWSPVWNTSLGEYYLGEHLRAHIPRQTALSAAAGWGGDHFQVYVDEADRVAWLLKLVWDTPEDGAEFAATYAAFNEARISDVGSQEPFASGTCYAAASTICVSADGALITSAPNVELALALMSDQLG